MVVITTPTGTNGHQVLERVLESDQPVRVLSRDPSRLPAEALTQVEVVQGSLDDRAAVSRAFAGADAAFIVVPPDPTTSDVVAHYVTFARTAAEAAQERGVKRLVWISTLGRDRATAVGHYAGALAADEYLVRASPNARTLRPAVYMDNLLWQVRPIVADGRFALPNAADRPHLTVATRDIAATAARFLLDDGWTGHEDVPLIGDRLTPNEMARVMSDVLDREITYHELTGDAYMARMMSVGASDAWARGLADMATAENGGFYETEPDTSVTSPTDFRTWAVEVLKPAVLAEAAA